MLALAVVLTVDRAGALRVSEHLVHDLSEGGWLLARFAHWLEAHLTGRTLGRGAIVAWLDGVTTALEALLLYSGHAWGEWVVVIGLGALVPFEFAALERHPTWVRLVALLVNVAIVAYLARLRLRARHSAEPRRQRASAAPPRAP